MRSSSKLTELKRRVGAIVRSFYVIRGKGSGMYNRVIRSPGMPVGILRKNQASSKLNRLYALIENKGGLYRSDDAGEQG
jgi:hypothetical protein